jgi:hypothetical protein
MNGRVISRCPLSKACPIQRPEWQRESLLVTLNLLTTNWLKH